MPVLKLEPEPLGQIDEQLRRLADRSRTLFGEFRDRGGEALETVERVGTIVFDKTGTLTEGKPSVTHVLGTQRSDG